MLATQRQLDQGCTSRTGCCDFVTVRDDPDHVDAARDGCGTAPLEYGAKCVERADVLQGTEGDDEPGIVGGECPRLKVGVDGLDAIGQAGRSGVVDEVRQGARG